MSKYAFIIGEAPDDYRMKKTEDMYNFFQTKEGGSFPKKNIITFPNGINEFMLQTVINNCLKEGTEEVLLYICKKLPIPNSTKTFFIGKEEIRFETLTYFENLAKSQSITFTYLFDSCTDIRPEEEFGFEEV